MRRRGTTLIELLVVLGVGSVVMGIAVTLLYALMRTEGSAGQHLRHGNVLSRLAEQFRDDVHAATSVKDLSDGQGQRFELPAARAVVYRLVPGRVLRSEQFDGQSQRRESFALSEGSEASITAEKITFEEIPVGEIPAEADAGPTIVSLVITVAPDGSPQPGSRPVRIDGVLARDHRLVKPRQPSSEDQTPSSEGTDG